MLCSRPASQTTQTVLSESGGLSAWLIIAARLHDQSPGWLPAPTHLEAQGTFLKSVKTAAHIKDALRVSS